MGGAYLKIGQILSTRYDLFPAELLGPLRRLQDHVRPFSRRECLRILQTAIAHPLEDIFSSFDPIPIASASIAQVHRAILRVSGSLVAVKVRRPDIERAIASDTRILKRLARIFSHCPRFDRIPLFEALDEICASLAAQADFAREAENHRHFCALLDGNEGIRIPRLIDELCSRDVLVMEFLPDLTKLTDSKLEHEPHRRAVITGLRALYRMIFSAGLIHCDLHPGNILVSREGNVVILDFGFVATMGPIERSAFAEFFLSIAVGDGATAARLVRDTALHVQRDLDVYAFEQEICKLINEASGRPAGEFLVAKFVAALFGIQRRHGICGSPSFTMAILSLMVYEGIIRPRWPGLDFQREAIPYVLSALEAGP
ncbi:MAG: AarF/UbiB family protein [Gammaproteobacteria bacterium]|nr:AarF/UbiB family protein [Gammaproteobacteria bacterium]